MSHRGELTARTIELLLLLTSGARSQRELIDRFRVNRKTVKRLIDALSLCCPVIEERRGREVFYSFTDGYEFKPPALTPPELATLLLAQGSIAATGLTASGSRFTGHARLLLARVRAALPVALRERLDRLAAIYGTAAVPAKDFAPHAAVIERLTDAALDRRRVCLRYHSFTDDRTKERLVDPYCIYFDPDGATLKLIGYDHRREAVIPLSIDHIRALHDTGERFTRPPDFDLQSYLSEHCFNGIHGTPITVRLKAYDRPHASSVSAPSTLRKRSSRKPRPRSRSGSASRAGADVSASS